jgi:ubiquinone/menaquinone biosynthesis C-methylase UbiE
MRLFDRMAASLAYDLFMVPLGWLGLHRARRRLVAGLRGRVLELGAGTGLLFAHYGAGVQPVGVDVDLAGLVRARRRAPRLPLVCADAQALPFRDGTFEAVAESLVFCSVPDVGRTLREAHRVLRPEGELRMLDHVRPPGALSGRLADALTPLWVKLSEGCHLDREPAKLLAAAGFEMGARRRSLRGLGDEVRARRLAKASP